MRKKTIGEVFRLERRNQGFSLEEIERKTDIQIEYLEAIEADEFDQLPSSFYARSFLKKYAQVLDLDEDIILEAYENASMITYDEVEVLPEDDRRMRRSRRSQSSALPLFYMVLFSLAMVLFIGYFVWQQYQSPTTKPSDSSVSVVTSQTASSESETVSSQTSASSEQPKGKLEVSSDGEVIVANLSGVTEDATLTLSADNTSSWLSISGTEWADGVTLSPTNASISTNLSRGTTTDITIGNTSGLTVKVNDQIIDLSSLVNLTGTIRLTITE